MSVVYVLTECLIGLQKLLEEIRKKMSGDMQEKSSKGKKLLIQEIEDSGDDGVEDKVEMPSGK